MKNEILLRNWTNLMEELISSGVTLNDCLSAISKLKTIKKRMRNLCDEIFLSLDSGMSLSMTLSSLNCALFPQWYTGIIGVCQESGSLKKTFAFLKSVLEKKAETIQIIALNFIYPVILMTTTMFLAFYLDRNFKTESFSKTFVFFAFTGFFYALIVKNLFAENQFLMFLKAMSFLWEKDIPLEIALETAANCINSKSRLIMVLSKIRLEILDGTNVAESFEKNMALAGFRKEGIILARNISLNLAGSKISPFEKTFNTINGLIEKKQQVFFRIQQPILLAISGIGIIIACGDMSFLYGGIK